jgi:hypothetical protein
MARSLTFIRRLILFLALLALPALTGAEIESPYASFWKYCFHYSKHWHPDVSVEEINCFCSSTWAGVNQDDRKARLYFHMAICENGVHQMDNKAGYGWGGATWPVIRKALGWKGPGCWLWAEKHPYLVNKAVSHYFASKVDESNIQWWHNSPDPINNLTYAKKVAWIRRFCDNKRIQ